MYLYITTRSESEIEIIRAECHKFAGAIPNNDGIAVVDEIDAESAIDISRSAYIKTCLEVISYVHSLSELYLCLEKLDISSDGFRVSVYKTQKGIGDDSQKVMHEVGLRIGGKPNLSEPKTTFLVVLASNDIWFGKVVSEATKEWGKHIHKAQQYSSALPTRLARAMLNLVAMPGDIIIDPCCGSGTILIEAVSIGIKAVGYDINPIMVRASMENLRHFGLEASVMLGDARDIKGKFDAVVTDLPYGKNCSLDERSCLEILQNLPQLAPKAIIVAGSDIRSMLSTINCRSIQIIKVRNVSSTRYIHISKFK